MNIRTVMILPLLLALSSCCKVDYSPLTPGRDSVKSSKTEDGKEIPYKVCHVDGEDQKPGREKSEARFQLALEDEIVIPDVAAVTDVTFRMLGHSEDRLAMVACCNGQVLAGAGEFFYSRPHERTSRPVRLVKIQRDIGETPSGCHDIKPGHERIMINFCESKIDERTKKVVWSCTDGNNPHGNGAHAEN